MTSNKKNLLIFLLPSLFLAIVFLFFPIVHSIFLSFFQGDKFVGFRNFKFLFSNNDLLIAFKHTFVYTIIVTSAEMFISLFIAYLLSKKIKFKNFFQTVFFLPYVTSVVAIGAVFKYMFHSQYGIINMALELIGINGPAWLVDPNYALYAVIILGIWKGLAFNILIIFTGLSTVNEDIEKAAIIDGFKPREIFVKIKLPQIYPVLTYLLTMNIIFNLKVYEEVVALFPTGHGGYLGATTIVYMLKDYVITNENIAATIAVLLLLVSVGIKLIQVLIKKQINKKKQRVM